MNLNKLLCLLVQGLVVMFAPLSSAQPISMLWHYERPIELSSWEYAWGDSPVLADGTPLWISNPQATAWNSTDRLSNPEGKAQDYLWLRTQLPDTLEEDMALAIRFLWMEGEVYLGDGLIYKSGDMEFDFSDRFEGFRFHMVDLPQGAAGKILHIRISSGFRNYIGVSPDRAYLGSENSIIQFGIRKDLISLLIGLIIVGIGAVILLLLVLSNRERQSKEILFYTGLFAVCYGMNYVCSHVLFYLMFPNTVLIYYLKGLFLLFPVGLLGLFECIIGKGPWEIINKMKHLHLVFWGALMMLDIVQIAAFFTLIHLFFITLAISLIVMFFAVVPSIKEKKSDSRIIGFAVLAGVVPGLFDTVFQGIILNTNVPSLSPLGSLLCMFTLAFLLDKRFSRNTFQLQKAHRLLEEHSSSLEDRVKKRTAELNEKNQQLQNTLSDLKEAQHQLVQAEKMASLGQLTAGIAHEIKNPLNFVNNFASLSIELADELEEAINKGEEYELIVEDLKMNAANIEKHGKRADRIVHNMMEHARSGSRELKPVVLNELVEEYVNLAFHGMRAQKEAINVSIVRNYDECLKKVILVPQEIGRVIINLCSNAFDAMRDKQRLSRKSYKPGLQIITRHNGRFAEVYIKDNGPGIDEVEKDKIFEPFYTTKPSGSGTGLGLSISYDIIVIGHKGQFEVVSSGSDGTEFVFRLPI